MSASKLTADSRAKSGGGEVSRSMFLSLFEDGGFMRAESGTERWILPCCVGDHIVQVIPDYDDGTMLVDIETGIVPMTSEKLLEYYAYAKFTSSFRFKFGEFATAPEGAAVASRAWRVGEPIHFYFKTPVGSWDSLTGLVEMLIRSAGEVRKACREIEAGLSAYDVSKRSGDDERRRLIDVVRHGHEDA